MENKQSNISYAAKLIREAFKKRQNSAILQSEGETGILYGITDRYIILKKVEQ
jgi:hypothetical protein